MQILDFSSLVASSGVEHILDVARQPLFGRTVGEVVLGTGAQLVCLAAALGWLDGKIRRWLGRK